MTNQTESFSKPLPPGRSGLPLVGETLQFLRNPDFVAQRTAEYGPIFRTHLLGRPAVIMSGPEASRFLLHEGMAHFSWGEGWPQNFRVLLGRSLFLMDGEEHKRNRKLLTPAFHGRALEGYASTINDITHKYLQQWTAQKRFPWFIEFKKMTFEIASTLLIGSQPGAENDQLSQYFTDLTNGLFAVPLNLPWTTYGKAIRARDALLAFVEAQIKQRQQQDPAQIGPRPDALTLLVHTRDEDGKMLDLEEIKAQAILLLFAGHETTTSMLTSACMYLAQYPAVWAEARAEQEAIQPSDPPSMEDVRRMVYLDQILKEIERLEPPVRGGFRGVVKPFEFNGYHVPAGWMVQYNIHQTHQNDELYPAPAQFDPQRFADEAPRPNPFGLIGFGGGPRICIGKSFALLEIKMVLSHLLRHYTWQLEPGQDLTMLRIPTNRPKDDLRVVFEPRPLGN